MSLFDEISYVIDSADRFVSVGGEWAEFAEDNHGANLAPDTMRGRSLWSFICDLPTRNLYADLLAKVRAGSDAQFELRCDAPECRRRLGMTLTLLERGNVEFRTVLLAHEMRPPQPFFDIATPRTSQRLKVCGWCGCIDVGAGPWREVEEAMDVLGLAGAAALPSMDSVVCERCQTEAR